MTTRTGMPKFEGVLEDEARLGQRALGGVHEEDRSVRHHQRPLDLPAEVGVAWGVDDVDDGCRRR